MSKPTELTIEMLVAAAKDQLDLSDEMVDQLRPILGTQVESINRLRAIDVDAAMEPDLIFDPRGGHD